MVEVTSYASRKIICAPSNKSEFRSGAFESHEVDSKTERFKIFMNSFISICIADGSIAHCIRLHGKLRAFQ